MDADTHQGNYFLDAENAGEMARLIKQARIMSGATGLLPPDTHIPPEKTARILDIGCGPGEWITAVARTYGAWEVWGVDISRLMTNYARYAAREAGLYNIHVRIMDVQQGLQFEDETFDLIHSRFSTSFLTPTTWPKLLSECLRVTKPGGTIFIAEASELAETNSAAAAKLNHLFAEVLRMGGHTFAPAGDLLGTNAVLPRLLANTGWTGIHGAAHLINGSYGEPSHAELSDLRNIMLHQLHPVAVKSELLSEVEFARLAEQLTNESNSPDFCCRVTMITHWATKPTEM